MSIASIEKKLAVADGLFSKAFADSKIHHVKENFSRFFFSRADSRSLKS